MLLRAAVLSLAGLLVTSCATPKEGFAPPLDDASVRETPLHFGLYVTEDPAHNPIDPPERFTGYHAALDFEILPGEESEEVPVYAICDGRVLSSRSADGYGGVLVQHCRVGGKPFTVLYGHLARDSMVPMRAQVKRGQKIAVLAPARSADSGGTRKHLHLGIHRGSSIVLLGYVQTPEELNDFVDPATVLGLPTRPWPAKASDSSASRQTMR